MNDRSSDLIDDAGDTLQTLQARLLAQFNADRPWSGRLSDSAVATAVATAALAQVDPAAHRDPIRRGLRWLADHQNADGGWGDSPDSLSNLAATVLAWSALGLAGPGSGEVSIPAAERRCEAWLSARVGRLAPESVAAAVLDRYGGDRTFPAPLLTLAAVAGRMGPDDRAWAHIPQLPFELAALPNRFFRWMNLTVVSYALPALIAVGLVRHRRRPTRQPLLRAIRDGLEGRLLDIALAMQPANGGYEEATPLTGFVTLSLAAAGHGDHAVVRAGVRFLLASQREHGGWPIDTDLATWVTVQSVMALAPGPSEGVLPPAHRQAVHRWLLAQQYTAKHPLTFGAPGGWGWTDLPGAMPDADDTAGVLLALRRLLPPDPPTVQAASRGIRWLLDLQNRDGGIPTFSRGWGKLPFDRSCPDLTAHALQAFAEWQAAMPPRFRGHVQSGMTRMARYLARSQSAEGSWLPLWFGSQAAPDELNPVYGTARTVHALGVARDLGLGGLGGMLDRGCHFLRTAQNGDGGWGARADLPSGIEETAVTLSALAGTGDAEALRRGVQWLVTHTARGSSTPASPVGLYFARLWYSEELYPLAFAAAALARAIPVLRTEPRENAPEPGEWRLTGFRPRA